MLLKDKDSSRNSFHTFSQFFYFDSSLGLQSDSRVDKSLFLEILEILKFCLLNEKRLHCWDCM